MMWRSAINEMPDLQYIETFEPNSTEYEEWLEEVTAEPWFLALEAMVKWTGTWVGTEERLFEELEMRAGKDVFASPDFPSDFERLTLYAQIARDGFAMKHIEFWHYRELTEEDLEHYDAPGWGPEAPILVFRDRAADRPDYHEAMCRLLARGDALPLAVLIFAGEDKHFRRSRTWTGTTTELIEKLKEHSPRLGPVPYALARVFRPKGERGHGVGAHYNPADLLDPWTREAYLLFHGRMRDAARTLGSFRIKIVRQKRTAFPGLPEDRDAGRRPRTYWTIEVPRWKKPVLASNPGIPARDLPVLIACWLADAD